MSFSVLGNFCCFMFVGLSEKFNGYVTHGINNFNGERIVDLSSIAPFNDIPYYEIGVEDEGIEEELPTESTNRNKKVVITSSFFEEWAPIIQEIIPGEEGETTMDLSLKNKPILDSIGVLYFGSQNVNDRLIPTQFKDADFTTQESFYPFGTNLNPTLSDWELASGQVNIKCKYDKTLGKHITIGSLKVCNSLPYSVYTVWEVGVDNAQSDNEVPAFQPTGGVGNVFRTDKYGNAEYEWLSPYCSLDPCLLGGHCTVYFSAFHHFDYSVWGRTFGGTTMKPYGYPAGVAGANHLWFPIKGEVLQQPITNIEQCIDKSDFESDSDEKTNTNKKGKRDP